MHLCLARLPLLAENNNFYALVIAAILVMTLPMLLRVYRYQARSKRANPVQLPAGPDPRGLRAGAPESIVRWEVQMQELGRDLKAEIDSKMVALGHLVRQADRAAERLEKALAAVQLGDEDPNRVDVGPLPDPGVSETTDLRDEVYLLADYGFSANDIASRLSTPIGQIELILRLREEKRLAGSGPPSGSPPGQSPNDR